MIRSSEWTERTMFVVAALATTQAFAPAPLPNIRPVSRPSCPGVALRMSAEAGEVSRRGLLKSAAAAAVTGGMMTAGFKPSPALAAGKICDEACKEERKEKAAGLEARPPSEDDLLLYFGAGCFWHVQHEMILAEKYILKRNKDSFTSVAGYAGGNKIGKEGKVCYHNREKDSDYGSMGHTEVVGVRIPADRVAFFLEAFLNLFNDKGVRADPQDRGGEYRSAIGLPGGYDGQPQVVALLKEYAADKGMKILPGTGDEQDTLKAKSIYVYDTLDFPFYAGELYHQYHDDMIEKYGKGYNAMRSIALDRGDLQVSKCPGDAPFLAAK
jgi:peptide methionine sulfoxide reductase MsrA